MKREQLVLFGDIEDRHWWFAARRRFFAHLADQLCSARARILDVGCGTGGNLAALTGDRDGVGVDASADAVALACERFPNLRFSHRRITEGIEAELADADLVLLTDVLEHVRDDFEFLSRLLAPMRPGSRLLLTVPAEEALWSPHDEAVPHFRRYDAPRLRAVWTGPPVRERLFSPFNAYLYIPVRAVHALTSRLRFAAGRANTDFSIPPQPVNAALEALFAHERHGLAEAIGRGNPAFPRGVSSIAILEREQGEIPVRRKPQSLPPDRFDPPVSASKIV